MQTKFLFVAASFLLVFVVSAVSSDVIYLNDFEDTADPLAEWSYTPTDVTPGTVQHPSDRFLGPFGSSGQDTDNVTLTLNIPQPHNSVSVSFDLYCMGSWDGNGDYVHQGQETGPDIWYLTVNGGPVLLHTTFSNEDSYNHQAYPDSYPGGINPAGTGASEIDTLGISYQLLGDSVYHLCFTFQHSANTLVLEFSSSLMVSNPTNDEIWGLDNVKVEVIPEPACVFSEDFDIDPCWISTEPSNIKWDPAGFYRARVTDNPSDWAQWGYSPLFQEVSDASFSLEFDVNPVDPSYGTYPGLQLIAEGVADPFVNQSLGISAEIADEFPGNFVMRGKPYGGSSPIYFSSPEFTVGEWYHQKVDYDAVSRTLTWQISLVGMPNGSFYNSTFTDIAIAPFNQVVVGYQSGGPVYGSWAEIYVDNILVCVTEPAEPDIEVSPLSHDFGDVELGSNSTVVVTISNVGSGELAVSGIALETDFAITSVPPASIVVEPNETKDVEITYTPTVLGYNSAVLKITSDDPDEPVVEVTLGAVGIEIPLPPSEQIANILAFFDESVEKGTLAGCGKLPFMAKLRLKAFRHMIKAAGDLIDGEWYGLACLQLRRILLRCDDEPWPPDFVQGEAVPQLVSMVQELRDKLGCE